MTEHKLTEDEAYNMIDRFLRNNLDDSDYAEFSAALDLVAAAPAPSAATPAENCNMCNGQGKIGGFIGHGDNGSYHDDICPACKGSGEETGPVYGPGDEGGYPVTRLCRSCEGTGEAATPASEPVAKEVWVVLDENESPIYCAGWPQACHEHITDALTEHDLLEAASWTVRKATIGATPSPAEDRRDAERFRWECSGKHTQSDALVKLAFRRLNGDVPTLEEYRTAYDTAMQAEGSGT